MYNKTRYNDKIVYLYINSTYSYHTIIFNFLKVISETYTKYIVIYLQSLPRRTPAWLLYKYIKCVLQCELGHSGDRTRKSGVSGSIFCDAPPNDHFYQTCFEPLSQMLMVLLFVVNRHYFFLHVLNNEVRGYWFYCVLYTGKCLLFTLVLNYEARSFWFTLYLNIMFIYLVILS